MNRPAPDQWRILLKCMELRNFTRTAEALDTDPAYVERVSAAALEVDRLLAEARTSGRKAGCPNGRKPL